MGGVVSVLKDEGLIYTNENCIGCNKCVGVCLAMGACISQVYKGKTHIGVDPLRCTACGACFSVCAHGARSYIDDTEQFFRALADGEQISVLISPTVFAQYPDIYGNILGTLRQMGVRHILPVAFGVDICTWAQLKYLRRHRRTGMISSRCPVIVSYIEHFHPELIPSLMPIQSPMMCMAVYARKHLQIEDKFAYIGPCIGKSFEKWRNQERKCVTYNITIRSLMKYLRARGLSEQTAEEELSYGLGLYYPAPDGLAANLNWFLGDEELVRSVSGKRTAYEWLERNAEKIAAGGMPFTLIDVLNCRDGCLEGTAREEGCNRHDEAYYTLMRRRRGCEYLHHEGPWSRKLLPWERRELFEARHAGLELSDYLRTYQDRSAQCQDWEPSPEEADAIYESMHKYDEASRHIDCSSCGYSTCADMMRAIYNGFNDCHNCIHYEQAEADRLEKLSLSDALTGVCNHNAYLQETSYGAAALELGTVFVMADVNGLKRANDTLGHAAGDRLLRTAAQYLAALFGKEHVYRVGGDEFVVLVTDMAVSQVAARLRNIQQQLEEMDVSIAVGTAACDAAHRTYKELKAEADAAMYKDKMKCYARHGWEPRA